MGEIINFNPNQEVPEDLDIQALDAPQLGELLEQLRQSIALLDEQEPKRMSSEAYESWGERHETLEDLVDEVLDRLDELE